MGYYTQYSLKTDADSATERQIIAKFLETNQEAAYALDEDGSCQESTKWYNAAWELKTFSLTYPDVLFTLEGRGESGPEDHWRLYVRNGNSQEAKAQITFAPPDLTHL